MVGGHLRPGQPPLPLPGGQGGAGLGLGFGGRLPSLADEEMAILEGCLRKLLVDSAGMSAP